MRASGSRTISGETAPGMLESRTSSTRNAGLGRRVTSMLPRIARSRPVASRTRAVIFCLWAFQSMKLGAIKTAAINNTPTATTPISSFFTNSPLG